MTNLISVSWRVGGGLIQMSCTVFRWQLLISFKRLPKRFGLYLARVPASSRRPSEREAAQQHLMMYLPTARVLPRGWMFRLGRYRRESSRPFGAVPLS